MAVGTIRPIRIEEELRHSYMDYAMSVIVSRALPDVRDGLKPVQRRILYVMDQLGLRPNTAHKKSARIVGEVLGKFHPHGDAPVYEAMVRLAQDFTLRYPLVDGQGNFGSIDNDPPAAMRYTEARMASITMEILADIDKDTVDFQPNFDGSLSEPVVLPSILPNLLANGSSGIAVGMATNIPPHNLGELCDALIHLIDNPDATLEELAGIVKGPDFPTGGTILGQEGIRQAYATGRGRLVVQGRAEIDGRQIVISEVPYLTNKAALVERIALLVKEKRLEGIAEVRDESDRHGLRVVVELRREGIAQRVLNSLYRLTALRSTYAINMLALVDGQPQLLPLKYALQHHIDLLYQVITRRSQYELPQAQERAHLV
jgi:DNA gyrase subunit A